MVKEVALVPPLARESVPAVTVPPLIERAPVEAEKLPPKPPYWVESGEPSVSELMVVAPRVALVAKRLVELAVVAKKLVDVAFDEVELSAVKFWSVVEPVANILMCVAKPVFDIEKSEVVAKPAVELEIAKARLLVDDAVGVRWMVRAAYGEVVPMPKPVFPLVSDVRKERFWELVRVEPL